MSDCASSLSLEAYEQAKELLDYNAADGVFTWKAKYGKVSHGDVAGYVAPSGYIRIKCCGKDFRANRLAWYFCYGTIPQKFIDHINGYCGDNRISNLREVTPLQSAANRTIHSDKKTSKFKGVYSNPGRKDPWRVYIRQSGKDRFVGSFPTEELANAAYQAAAESIHGAFAEHLSRPGAAEAIVRANYVAEEHKPAAQPIFELFGGEASEVAA
jgi:hypothetical protein